MKTYFLKKPTAGNARKTFAVICRSTDPNGVTKNKTIRHEAIDAVNQALLSGGHNLTYCELQLKAVIKQLKGADNPLSLVIHNPENLKILDRFWADEYSHRRIKDLPSMYADYRRAVEALGNLSLLSSTDLEFQRVINSSLKGKKQRRVVSRLSTLLKYLGRRVKLTLDQKDYVDILYLSESDLLKIVQLMEPNFALLCKAAFYSGLRLGELFALEPINLRGAQLAVNWQIKPDGSRELPKRGKRRKAYIPPKGRVVLKSWCEVESEVKVSLRGLEHSKVFKKACRRTFPQSPTKHLRFHDLRHSYAVYMLGRNINLSLVAKSLGNGEQVCQEYYSGFTALDADIEAMDAIFEKNRS